MGREIAWCIRLLQAPNTLRSRRLLPRLPPCPSRLLRSGDLLSCRCRECPLRSHGRDFGWLSRDGPSPRPALCAATRPNLAPAMREEHSQCGHVRRLSSSTLPVPTAPVPTALCRRRKDKEHRRHDEPRNEGSATCVSCSRTDQVETEEYSPRFP